MTYKLIIEAIDEIANYPEVEQALNDLNIALGDGLITWKEGNDLHLLYKDEA